MSLSARELVRIGEELSGRALNLSEDVTPSDQITMAEQSPWLHIEAYFPLVI